MFYQNREVWATTLAISESLKFRKASLENYNPSKQNLQVQKRLQKQTVEPLFQKNSSNYHCSTHQKKEARRKAGSVGKIKRNQQSFNQQKQSRNKNQNEQIGLYKSLFDQNRVLNEALRFKMYQNDQNKQFLPENMPGNNYNFAYGSDKLNESSHLIYNLSGNNGIIPSIKKQNLQNKYQTMIKQYDQKRNFIKEEIQAMKQNSTLQSFQKYDSYSKNQQPFSSSFNQKSHMNQKYNQPYKCISMPAPKQSYNQLGPAKQLNICKQAQIVSKPQINFSYQKVESSCQDSQYHSRNRENGRLASSDMRVLSSSNNLNIMSNVKAQKQNEIDKKYKAYQEKFQKYQSLEKRNPSKNNKPNSQNQKLKPKNQNDFLHIKLQNATCSKVKNTPINTFAELLSKQIQKDQQVRQIKASLKKLPVQQAILILKNKLAVDIDPQKLKLSPQQYDPFCEEQKNELSAQQQLKKFINAHDLSQNYWHTLVKGRLDNAELGSIYDSLNNGRVSQLKLSEFTRQVSFHLKKTIRTRQIYSVFQRLYPLTRQNFIQKLSKN